MNKDILTKEIITIYSACDDNEFNSDDYLPDEEDVSEEDSIQGSDQTSEYDEKHSAEEDGACSVRCCHHGTWSCNVHQCMFSDLFDAVSATAVMCEIEAGLKHTTSNDDHKMLADGDYAYREC